MDINTTCPHCFKEKHTDVCPNCGFDSTYVNNSPSVLPPFTLLNHRYLLGHVLGQGGFGITYIALDTFKDIVCCAKEYMPSEYSERNADNSLSPNSSENCEVFEHGKESFLAEAKSLFKLENNPNVVTITDFFSENNTGYLVMDYLDGMNLKRFVMKCGNKIWLQNAKTVLTIVAQTLESVHSLGILHRDISPENIFITNAGQVILIDFGASRSYLNQQSEGMSVLLKPGFAPPEQYNYNGNQGPWTDIYSLAATFYTIVSGEQLIPADYRLREDTQKPLKELDCGVSDELSDVIEKAMSLDYHQRYQTMSEFLSDITGAIKTLAIESETPEKNSNKQPKVKVIAGKRTGSELNLSSNTTVVIGRSMQMSALVVDDGEEISRAHCYLRYDDVNRQFVIIDKSSNGTYLDTGERFPKNIEKRLMPGDRFYLATPSNMLIVVLE